MADLPQREIENFYRTFEQRVRQLGNSPSTKIASIVLDMNDPLRPAVIG